MRLLLIEDEKTLSKVISTLLKQNNYTVDSVFDGKEALQLLNSNETSNIYDGIILDLILPKINGIEVLNQIRKNGNKTPVLILSAKSEIDDKVKGLDSGANDYLTKPFDSKELLARIRVLLRQTSIATNSVIKIANLSLDSSSCRISTPKGCYYLVGKEYQILLLFMNNYNCILSAEKIMEKIWEFDSEANINTVWTYISYIRRKLEALESKVQIFTKRNLGYILEKL